MRPRYLLSLLLLAATATPTAAQAWSPWVSWWWWEPPPACAEPTTAQCLDPAYRETTCGREKEPVCRPILQAHAQHAWNASPTAIEPVMRPDDGRLTDARVTHFDMGRVSRRDLPPAFGFLSQRGVTGLEAIGATTESGQPIRTRDLHQWRPIPQIASCDDYVYKKWFGYRNFESSALACGNDDECVYQAAIAPTHGLTARLRMLDQGSTPMSRQIQELHRPDQDGITWIPKNGFFELDWRTLVTHSAQWHASSWNWLTGYNPEVAATKQDLADLLRTFDIGSHDLVANHSYRTEDLFEWHRERHDEHEALGLTFDEEADMERRQDGFRKLAVEHRNVLERARIAGLVLDANGVFSLGWRAASDQRSNDSVWPIQAAYNAVVNQMTNALVIEWRHRNPATGSIDRGCLAGAACDWSPKQFTRTYLGLWHGERAQDLARCHQSSVDMATAPPVTQVPRVTSDGVVLENQSWDAGTRDLHTFERLMTYERMRTTAMARDLPYRPAPAAGATRDVYKTLRWAIDPVDHEYGVKHLLYAKYEQKAVVELGVAAKVHGASTQICSLNVGAYGKLKAEIAWPSQSGWPESHVLIDGLIQAGVGRDKMEHENAAVTNSKGLAIDFQGHLKIGGESIFEESLEVPDAYTARTKPRKVGRFYKEKVHPFSILGIPAYAQIIVEGQPSYEASFQVSPRRNAGACGGTSITQDVSNTVSATLTGRMDVNAIARLGIGIPGISVGIKGQLQVLKAEVPVNARLGFTANGTQVALRFETDATLTARMLSGYLALFAEVLFLKEEAVFFRWDGLPIDALLWRFQKDLPIADLAALFPEQAP